MEMRKKKWERFTLPIIPSILFYRKGTALRRSLMRFALRVRPHLLRFSFAIHSFFKPNVLYISRTMKRFFAAALFAAFISLGCAQGSGSGGVTVINWNLQTFFDGNYDGIEYPSYRKNAKWNEETYRARLERLCRFIKQTNADLYVFEEVENEKILYDISNCLAERSWNLVQNRLYASFAKDNGSAIGCAVLSRFPLSALKLHTLDVRTEDARMPSMRPIMEVRADIDGRALTIFVNHWKSKFGGAEKSEVWRNRQEALLAGLFERRAQSGEAALLACGDFNRDMSEFVQEPDGTVCLRKGRSSVAVASAWPPEQKPYPFGSYYYEGRWERIDAFFYADAISVSGFEPLTGGEWANERGIPRAYKLSAASGWSDHLPIKCTVHFTE